jgi:hypothetical protein
MDVVGTTTRGAAAVGGQALRAAAGALAALRPTPKPLHPAGTVLLATLRRFGGPGTSSSPWLDSAAEDPVLVRISRAVGLPSPVPDVFGLALRVPLDAGRHGDVLFASTGLGRVTRFTLTLGRTPYSRPMTTLLPYRTPSGPVLLGAVFARPRGGEHAARDRPSDGRPRLVDLSWARPGGAWHQFARLELPDPTVGDDALVSFDPVLNPLTGLSTYGWVRRLREPSYVVARRSRGSRDT